MINGHPNKQNEDKVRGRGVLSVGRCTIGIVGLKQDNCEKKISMIR